MIFENWQEKQLAWLPELGIGYYPVKESPYDESYFKKYVKMDGTKQGQELTKKRIALCGDINPKKTLDIGIGGGKFVKDFGCFGFDINEAARYWLNKVKKFGIPAKRWENMTFWDSLEHIHNPGPLLVHCKKNVFVSMPIYKDCGHILRSKHYRKDEHCWYFTDSGLKLFMRHFGFECVSQNTNEQPIREDIHSYHFQRIKV